MVVKVTDMALLKGIQLELMAALRLLVCLFFR